MWAPTPERLHALAAEALASQLAGAGPGPADVTMDVSLVGHDAEDLLVHWLNTVILKAEVERAVWSSASVRRLTPHAIEATLRGQRFDAARHERRREVKAVSFHDLALELAPGRCRCRLILDI